MVIMSAFHTVGRGFASRPGLTKDRHTNDTNYLPARNALGYEFGNAAQLSKKPGRVWNCLWVHALKRSPGINRASRVSYPAPGFLSSATLPSLQKKQYNVLINQSLINIPIRIL